MLYRLGYARFRHWRIYGEEGLAGRKATLWLAAESLTVEHAGEPLSRYGSKVKAGTGRLRAVGAEVFETSYRRDSPQQRFHAPRTWARRGD